MVDYFEFYKAKTNVGTNTLNLIKPQETLEPGLTHIQGPNSSGKTTFINNTSTTELSILKEPFLELTAGKLADLILKFTCNIPFTKISNSVKEDINKLNNAIAFEKGKLESQSITFEKKEISTPSETLKLLDSLEKKIRFLKESRTSEITDLLKKPITENSVKVKGLVFTPEYVCGQYPELDKFNSNSIEDQLTLKFNQELIEKHKWPNHSELLDQKIKMQTQQELQNKYSKMSKKKRTETENKIKELEKELNALKKFKSALTTRKYQKEILNSFYTEFTVFTKSTVISGTFKLTAKDAKYNGILFKNLSGSEKVILELLFRMFLSIKIPEFDTLFIDESLDRISDISKVQTLLEKLKSTFRCVGIVTHRKDISELKFDQLIFCGKEK